VVTVNRMGAPLYHTLVLAGQSGGACLFQLTVGLVVAK
jgi:hypothetical protein